MENKILGKRVRILFDDNERTGNRTGVITEQDDFFIVIDKKDWIPKHRVVRMEVQ